jgi:hypothetical protein
MRSEIQYQLIRQTLDQLKAMADQPSDDFQRTYGEFCALTSSLTTLTKAPSLPSLNGPVGHFDEHGHYWL